MFFPVFKDNTEAELLEVLRPIEDYVLPRIPPETITANNIPSLLTYLIDFNILHGRHFTNLGDTRGNVTGSFLFHLTAKYFGISEESSESVQQINNLINSFSYEPLNEPFFGYLQDNGNSYKLFCEKEQSTHESKSPVKFSINAICSGHLTTSNETLQLSNDCKWYCQSVANNKEIQEKIRSFYSLAVDLEGSLVPGNPATLLPVCRFPGESQLEKDQCWRRIVTDKGICFSSVAGEINSSSQ